MLLHTSGPSRLFRIVSHPTLFRIYAWTCSSTENMSYYKKLWYVESTIPEHLPTHE